MERTEEQMKQADQLITTGNLTFEQYGLLQRAETFEDLEAAICLVGSTSWTVVDTAHD